MKKRYSIYEAKAKLSEIIRTVKKSSSVIITERGVDVACVAPVDKAPMNSAERIRGMIRDGLLQASEGSVARIHPIARRRGALKRFLESRE